MTPICGCNNPIVKSTESGELYCERCGYWYSEEHGSGRKKMIASSGATKQEVVITRVEHKQKPDPYALCGCGSGKKNKWCCKI